LKWFIDMAKEEDDKKALTRKEPQQRAGFKAG
jgi:hypothetical protein